LHPYSQAQLVPDQHESKPQTCINKGFTMKTSLSALFVAAGILGSSLAFAATPAPAAAPAPAPAAATAAAPAAAPVTTPAKKRVKKHAAKKVAKKVATPA
jgi:hypothetical protein